MRALGTAVVAFGALCAFAEPVRAESGTVKAVSAWEAAGQMIRSGEDTAFFVGAFHGIMFIENKEGVLDAARITCPGSLDIDMKADTQTGEGRCVITGPQGDRVFAKWTCKGVHGDHCAGQFTFAGGTGRFEKITGGGEFEFRTAIADSATREGSDIVEHLGAGIATWPRLKYELP